MIFQIYLHACNSFINFFEAIGYISAFTKEVRVARDDFYHKFEDPFDFVIVIESDLDE